MRDWTLTCWTLVLAAILDCYLNERNKGTFLQYLVDQQYFVTLMSSNCSRLWISGTPVLFFFIFFSLEFQLRDCLGLVPFLDITKCTPNYRLLYSSHWCQKKKRHNQMWRFHEYCVYTRRHCVYKKREFMFLLFISTQC